MLSYYYWRLKTKFLDFLDWLFLKKKLNEMEKKILLCKDFRIKLKQRSNSIS